MILIMMHKGNKNLVFNVNSTYLPLYAKLSSEWSGHKIIISSVNPIKGDVRSGYGGYTYSNVSVNQFNAIIKPGISKLPNFTYCDVNSQIASTFKTGDGIHYYGETYKVIFQLMNNCIKN